MTVKLMPLFFILLVQGYALPLDRFAAIQDSAAADSVKTAAPDYTDVDVVVKTDWGTTDKTKNVDVFIRKERGKHTEIVMKKSEHQECIVELVPGIVVQIINSKTGKVLKTIKP